MVLQSLCPLWHWQRQQRDGSGAELLDCAARKNEKVCRTDHNILQWSIKQRSNRYITLLVWLIYWVFIVFLSVLCSSTFNVHGKLTAQATIKTRLHLLLWKDTLYCTSGWGRGALQPVHEKDWEIWHLFRIRRKLAGQETDSIQREQREPKLLQWQNDNQLMWTLKSMNYKHSKGWSHAHTG